MGRSAMSILADLWLVLRQPFFLFFFWLLCWTSCVIKVLSGMVFPFKKGYRILSAHTEQLYSSLVGWLHFGSIRKHRELIYLDLEGKVLHPKTRFIYVFFHFAFIEQFYSLMTTLVQSTCWNVALKSFHQHLNFFEKVCYLKIIADFAPISFAVQSNVTSKDKI